MSAVEQLDRTILLCRDHVDNRLRSEEICEHFQSTRVLCVADSRNLSSHTGQTALVTVVSLLSRMGMQVALDIPDLALISPQPPIPGPTIRDALIKCSQRFITGAVIEANAEPHADVVFVLGDTKTPTFAGPTWRLSGDDWVGELTTGSSRNARCWSGAWPIGSMVSASLAANEAFKHVMRKMSLRCEADAMLFEPSPVCSWSFGLVPPPDGVLDLGDVDIISAGAISQAALFALVRIPLVRMRGRIFDKDETAPSNMNRNMLSLLTDISSQKVTVVTERCYPTLRLQAVPEHFIGGGSLASRVLVGVDDIPTRWLVQRSAPDWVGVSGTSHFGVISSSHSPNDACSGCLHFQDDDGAREIPTISFVSFWAGLTLIVRLVREALGVPYAPNRQQLWMVPLRMDLRHSAMWLPVPPRTDCPVQCRVSRHAFDA